MSEQTAKPESTLRLTVDDLEKCFRDKLEKGKKPVYYHFKTPPEEFHRATLVLYTGADGATVVLKDLYSRMQKRRDA